MCNESCTLHRDIKCLVSTHNVCSVLEETGPVFFLVEMMLYPLHCIVGVCASSVWLLIVLSFYKWWSIFLSNVMLMLCLLVPCEARCVHYLEFVDTSFNFIMGLGP